MKQILSISRVVALALGLSLLAPQHAAKADVYMAWNGGGACKGASGFGAELFYFSNLYVENTSTATQYLTCVLPMWRKTSLPWSIDGSQGNALFIGFTSNGSGSGVVTCVVQLKWDGQSGAAAVTSTKSTPSIPAGGQSFLSFLSSDLPIKADDVPTTISCALPGGMRMTWIDQYQPEQ